MNLEELFIQHKEKSLFGRYITLEDITPLLNKWNTKNQLQEIGTSVQGRPIYEYKIGQGKIKIFLWSQMHGNESTTTKALFDFINLLNSNTDYANQLLKTFTFCCLPMLNPDGAAAYTRVNANQIDLNRDSQDLSQPESRLLRATFERFQPDYCYNLHDQRTIFGVADTGKPATVSFLAPAYNEAREMNETRLKAVNIIAAMNETLQQYIPGQIGRFDDSFNINCIGDMFQYLGVPTILFEAGHFPNDYQREKTREYIFMALVSSFNFISENDVVHSKIDEYLRIPQNKINFYDFIYKNIKINYDGNEIITNFAAHYKEELINNTLNFNAYFIKFEELDGFFGHFEYNGEGMLYSDTDDNVPKLDKKASFRMENGLRFTNGSIDM